MTKATDTVSLECRFATFCKSNKDDSDLHVVKEVRVDSEGKSHPQLRFIKDFERPYWLVQKGLRNYKEQKEWIPLSDLIEYRCTQSQLTNHIKKNLGVGWTKQSLRDLKENIYIFGADITSTSLIKREYHRKYNTFTPFTNAVGDTETDMIYGHGEIQMATISQKERVYTVIKKEFVEGQADVINRIKALANTHIGDVITARNIEIDIEIVDTEIDVVRKWFAKAHKWKPDFFSFWNVAFDINKVLEACKRAGVDPTDIFCDPSVPHEYRSFNWKEGPAKKVTASGVVMSYKPSQRWHTLTAPASFYIVDAMCAYRYIRMGKPEEKSYALDYLLYKNLKITKLKFVEASKYKGADWHRYMQRYHPLEYIVYNIFDCVSMEMLDEKTRDLQLQLPLMSRYADFRNFNSQPQKVVVDLHYHLIEKENCVIAMTSGEMKTDMDSDTVSASNWITMLPQERVVDNGLKCLTELGDMRTLLRAHAGD